MLLLQVRPFTRQMPAKLRIKPLLFYGLLRGYSPIKWICRADSTYFATVIVSINLHKLTPSNGIGIVHSKIRSH